MRKTLLALCLFLAQLFIAQHHHHNGQTCGVDHIREELDRKYPENKAKRLQFEENLRKMNKSSFLKSIGATSVSGKYTGKIYEIPIVVHIIESSHSERQNLKLTDEQVEQWVENANKMYAGTYGNEYFSAGDGIGESAVIPFRLVLAKRTPQCTPTNGIIRYNGSSIEGYDENGLKYGSGSDAAGVTEAQIKQLAPHWPESSYFNIYIITGFNGNYSSWGVMGYCYYPSSPDSYYCSFMKAPVVKNQHDSTLAHEFGHGLGLDHPFQGNNETPPNASSVDYSYCPPNENCQTDNDKVCDTEPTANLLNVWPTPSNDDINICTGNYYNDVQYNIMNYTHQKRKFTAGQRERALAVFMNLRSNLTESLGGTPLDDYEPKYTLTSSCVLSNQAANTGDYYMGPSVVKLRDINNATSTKAVATPEHYIDYNQFICMKENVYTDIPKDEASELEITIGGSNAQWVKAWIDYNDNGEFEDNESIGAEHIAVGGTAKFTFTPPADAVKGKYLRLRVLADFVNRGACEVPAYGQIEDYAVRIPDDMATNEVGKNALEKDKVTYNEATNQLLLKTEHQVGFGDYAIYDMAGNLIQKGKTKVPTITISKNLVRGVYIVHYTNDKGTNSKKFVK